MLKTVAYTYKKVTLLVSMSFDSVHTGFPVGMELYLRGIGE